MTELILYGFAPSTYTRTARMTCVEAGVAHTLEPLAFHEPSHFALHPYGKMPVLRHGDLVLFETLAISAYVDSVFGRGRLQPQQPLEHARMLQWISVTLDYAYRDVVGALVKAGTPTDTERATARRHLERMDAALSGSPHLAGAPCSLADLFLFPIVDYAIGGIGPTLVEGLPHLLRWHASFAARPSAGDTAA